MKTILTKIKLFFNKININLNVLLICITIIVSIFGYTQFLKHKELNIQQKEQEMIRDILAKSSISQSKADSILKDVIIEQNKINQNEKIDWTDLYTSDPDSIARKITEWNNRQKNNN